MEKEIFLSAQAMPESYEDLGFVSGYCILGTGPISAIMAFFSDLFGRKSDIFSEKIDEAESTALARLRHSAKMLGGSAVFDIRVSVSEATRNHGMIIVYASGSAAKPI